MVRPWYLESDDGRIGTIKGVFMERNMGERRDKPVEVRCTKCGGVAGALAAGERPVLGKHGTEKTITCSCGQKMGMRVSNG